MYICDATKHILCAGTVMKGGPILSTASPHAPCQEDAQRTTIPGVAVGQDMFSLFCNLSDLTPCQPVQSTRNDSSKIESNPTNNTCGTWANLDSAPEYNMVWLYSWETNINNRHANANKHNRVKTYEFRFAIWYQHIIIE